jgi:hypothetical protein
MLLVHKVDLKTLRKKNNLKKLKKNSSRLKKDGIDMVITL